MVRRTRQDAEETREHILDAAEQCFRDTGVSRTTLQMIAAKAGCTRGAIYWHFREKNDLLKQVIERTPLFLFAEIEAIKRCTEPVASLRHCLIRGLMDLKGNRRLRNVIEMIVFRHEYPDAMSDEDISGKKSAEKLMSLIGSILLDAKIQGKIRADIPVEILSALIFHVFIGALKAIILMPSDGLLFRNNLSALNLIFDIAAGKQGVCNAT
ncbi:TetR family transcriptional regulator [Brenneria populi]|uniref:TetR family transcriptional regulator n=1 Tax=Brenneria populi TaxID=1505588 RepID=A0ABU6JMZ4_9GAMM|nr:TetR family transcriptional regulator [Brenneria populi Li et al. 2015]